MKKSITTNFDNISRANILRRSEIHIITKARAATGNIFSLYLFKARMQVKNIIE
jgi:hypothetical protein